MKEKQRTTIITVPDIESAFQLNAKLAKEEKLARSSEKCNHPNVTSYTTMIEKLLKEDSEPETTIIRTEPLFRIESKPDGEMEIIRSPRLDASIKSPTDLLLNAFKAIIPQPAYVDLNMHTEKQPASLRATHRLAKTKKGRKIIQEQKKREKLAESLISAPNYENYCQQHFPTRVFNFLKSKHLLSHKPVRICELDLDAPDGIAQDGFLVTATPRITDLTTLNIIVELDFTLDEIVKKDDRLNAFTCYFEEGHLQRSIIYQDGRAYDSKVTLDFLNFEHDAVEDGEITTSEISKNLRAFFKKYEMPYSPSF